MNRNSKLLIVLSAILLVVVGGLLALQVLPFARSKPKVVSSGTVDIGGPFTLIASDGKTVTDRTYRGKWEIIYFGYTHCPDDCPVALANLSIALKKLGSDASKAQALFITVDPKRDTQKVMAKYLRSFDPRIMGLTGSQAQNTRVTKEYRVYVEPHKSKNGELIVDHSAYFYVMNPQGVFATVIGQSASGEAIAERLRKRLSGSSS